MAGFGAGIGAILGNAAAKDTLDNAGQAAGDLGNSYKDLVSPNIQFGQSFLPAANTWIGNAASHATNTKSYDQFMQDYETTPAAQYLIGQGTEATNNSAAAKGGLLSGSNLRALSTMQQGIASQSANQSWNSYLSGNQNQFGQLQSLVGNIFSGIGVGSTATGQYGGVLNNQMTQQSALAQKKAEADKGKGSGFGSLFDGLGSIGSMF